MRLSIATKIFLAFTAMLITFAGVLAFNVQQMSALAEEVVLINGGYVPLRLVLSDIKTDLRTYGVLLAESDPEALKRSVSAVHQHYNFPSQIDIKLRRAEDLVESLRKSPVSERDSRFLSTLGVQFSELRALNEAFMRQSESFSAAVLAGRQEEGQKLQTELRSMNRGFESKLRASQQSVREEIDTSLLRAQRRERRSLGGAVVLSLIALALSAGIMLVIHFTIRPLRRLTEGAKRIAGGDFQPVEPVRSKDEIGVLAAEFNAMVHQLADRDAAIREKSARLVKSERLAAVGEIATKVTHELRNPLSTIRLNSELLADELADNGLALDSEPQGTLRNIVSEVERLTALTEDYLRFARLPDPNPTPGDLNGLVEDVIDFQRDELEASGITVDVALDPSLPEVPIDEAQFRRALLNLLRNAREATETADERALSVRTWFDPSNTLPIGLEIRDTGCGIPPDQVARIFEPFFSTKAQGTGLGLPLTHQIVEEHQGTILCDSVEGKGTCFSVRLPAATV